MTTTATTSENIVYVTRPPWADVGVEAQPGQTGPELRAAAGMSFKVLERNLYYVNPTDEQTECIDDLKALVRGDTGKKLSVMGGGYNVVQWEDAFGTIDEVVARDLARYIAAGTLYEGRVGYMLARLGGPDLRVLQTDDFVERYLLFMTSFDGSVSTHFDLLPLRMWSQSTLAANVEGASRLSIRHTAGAQDKLAGATELAQGVIDLYDGFGDVINALASMPFTDTQMKQLAAFLFPPKRRETPSRSPIPAHGDVAREMLLNLFENGRGNQHVRGTAWAAWNAVAEFADHYRMTRVAGEHEEVKRREARLASLWFGKSGRMKLQALERIKQLAEAI